MDINEKFNELISGTGQEAPQLEGTSQPNPILGIDFRDFTTTNMTGKGERSMSDAERDMQRLSPWQLSQKYGTGALNYATNQRDLEQQRYVRDEYQPDRTGGELLVDSTLDLGIGAVGVLGGLAALGTSVVDRGAGQSLSRGVNALTKGMTGLQTDKLATSRNQMQRNVDMSRRDNKAIAKSDLERIGRDVMSSLANYNAASLQSDITQGIGSMLALGPLGRGAAGIGSQITGHGARLATARATGTAAQVANLERISRLANTGTMAAVIGTAEGGSAYMDTVNHILDMPLHELQKSPVFQRALEETKGDVGKAVELVADAAGKRAALHTAPWAAAAGLAVGRFEMNPLRTTLRSSAKARVGNTALQTVEEGFQEGKGTYESGRAIRDFADPSYDHIGEVGGAIAQGAATGAGMAGVFNAPVLAAEGVLYLGGKGKDIFTDRIKKADLNAEKGAGIDAETVNAVSTAAQQTQADFAASMEDAVATMAPEEQERGAAQFQKIYDLGTHTDGQYDNPTLNQVTEGSSNKFEAINRLAHVAGDESVAPELRIQAGIALVQAANDVHDVINESPLIFENLADDHPAVVAANNIVDTVNATLQVKSVREAVTAAEQMIAEMEAPVVTEESFNTPEGQENVQTTIQLAEVAPDKVNVDSARVILAQAKQGTIELSPKQQRSLEYSVALMEAEANRLAIAPKDSVSIVSKQISLERGEKGLPLKDHIKNIQRAEQAKDTAALETAVNALANFVEHMNNKVSALNKSAQDGQNHQYMAYNSKADKWFQTDGKGLFFNPNSEASLNLAATVQHEAAVATDVLNNVYELLGSNERVANVSINSPLVPKIEAVSPQVADPFGEVADPAPSRQAFTEKEEAMYDKSRKNALREKLESQRGLEKDTDLDKAAQNMDTKSIEKELNRLNRKGAKKLTEQDKLDQAALRKELKNRSDVIMAPARAKKAVEEVAQEIRAEDAKKANAERVSETGQARTDAARAVSPLNGSQLTTLQMQAMEMMTQEEFDSFMKGEDIGLSIEELNAIKEMADSIRNAKVRPKPKKEEKAEEVKEEPTQQVQEEAPKAEAKSDTKAKKLDTTPADTKPKAEKKMPTTAERFPALARLGDIANNMFVRTFNLRGEDKNRLANEDSPVSFINSFLGSAGKISNLLGDVWGNKVTDHTVLDAWKDYMVTGDLLKEQVNKNLQTWLHAKKKSGSKFLDFSTQQPAFESADNVLIHLTEEGVDANGNPTYNFNEKLLEGSVLAAMSWLINDALAVNNRDIEDVAKTLGIHEHDVTPEVLAYYNEGVIKNFSIQDLGKKIQDFWGVSNKGDGYIGDQQGLTEGMARLLLDSMTQMGILKQEEQLVIPKTDGYGMPMLDAKGEPQTNPLPLKLVTQNALPAKEFNTQEEAEKVAEALQNTSSLLDELILTEPEKPIYVGKEAYPHKKSAQIRNSLANLTYQQKQVQKRANSKNFHVNTNMAAIFGLFGSEGITEAFSTVTQNPDMYNVKDFKIIEARNKAMASSFEELGRILYEVKAVSEVEGTSIHDTPIHFGHEFSSVNRLQQQGRYTPQSSKLLREVILPTWADMDLSGNNEQHLTNFRMMLAQAFDIALHKNTWENANAELTEVLSKLDGAIELTDNLLAHVDGNDLLDQHPSSMNFAKRLREEFDKAGVELSPLTLHALVEYTRFTKATNDELKNFRTSLYLEADGMTNGPANAMIMYSGSEISADWIGNMESAGMYINQPEANAGLKNNQKDAGRVRDLYEKGAERLQRLLRANQETLANSGVLKLFHIFENKSFSLGKQDDGLWDSQIGRNLIKNPLTVMLYGSGVSGVAGKLASNMLDSVYSEMSKALHRMHQNPELSIAQALFPSESLELSERRLAFFEEQLGKATSERGGYQRRYKFRTAEDLKNFQIVGGAFAQLTRNTFNDLAKPMHEAISETVGNKVMDNSEMIRNATNIMSIVAADLHKQLLDAEIEKNSKDKNYRKRQLVTFDRARELERQASEMAASMTSGTQNHLVQKVGEHEFKYDSHVAIVGAKSGSKGHTSTLGEAGVKGSAAMTISIDGQMVQNGIMTEKDIWQRQLEVFDGVNTPGDGIQDAGQQMNQAVWDSWNDNTMGMVADRFGTFLKNLDLGGLSDETKISITKLFSEKPRDVVEPYSDDSLANLTQNLQKRLDKEGKAHAALMEVLSEMPITVDQMAGTYNPLVRNPDVGMQPRTPEELAEYIQQKVNDKLGLPKYQTEGGYAGMLEGAKYNKDGNVVQQDKLLSATELYEIAKTGLMNRAQKEIMFRALKSGFLKNWRVLTGDAKSLRKRAKSGMIDGKALEDMLSKDVEGYADMGYYSEGRRTLVLLNDSVETLVHETIHATTYDKFDAFYRNESEGLSKIDIEAIQRIEALMEQFMAEDVADTLQHMPATMEKIQFVQKVVQDLLDQGNKAAAVNEFMSWTLGNDLLAERASRVKAPKFVQLARDVLKALKKLVFGDKAPYVGDDVLSNLVFNTAVLIQEQAPALETVIEDQVVLAQANSKNQSLTESVNNYITSNAELSPTQKKNIKDFTDAAGKLTHVAEAIRIAKAAFPSMTEGDLQTFGMVNSVLATENGFDSKAMREAAHVYDHVIANLKVSDFVGDKITAQAKFNAVVGRDLTGKDEFGRTAMLPTFVGLAMTVPEVSEILSKMDMPPRWKSREKGMDGVIENIGFLALENLGNRFTDPKKTPQVQAAMEVLGNEFVRNQTESQNVLMGTIGKAGSMMDMANQKLVDGMQALANVLYPEMTKEEQEKRTSLQKGMDIFGAGIASIISEPHAKIVAKGVSEQLDKTDGIPAFLRDLSNDLIGRNDSNKLLWDMVKHFRSKIQVVRQNYRADLPKVIRSKFKKPLSRKVWASLNTSMGKTGIGSLALNGIDLKDAMTLAESSKERKARIKQLEGAFQHNTIEKAKQLAHFMNTRETGSYLLRNAEAIAKHTGHEGRVEAIAEIDHLVTLYALEGLSQADQNILSNLVKSEPEGMEFLIAYLSSQIAEERAKAVGTMAQFNYYKGNLPFEMKQDVSLRIADDAEGAKLISMGYKKLEAFKGSNLAPVRGKSYYYSPNSPTVAFSQGIVQNVRQTVSGVDMGTGHTLDTVVNRITKPHEVERITKNLHREKGLHLIPVFNEKGDVIAYEQRIDPNLEALVQDEADLASTIGKWRGRQVEEYLSKFSNDALVQNLVRTYENDLKESKSNADRYVDLFESTDPVVVDALSLMPNDLRAQISEAMDGKFLVQRGMVKDVLGYRKATYTDSWTGVTRWSPEAQKVIKNAAVGIMGEKAFTRLREAQRIQENLVLNAKVIIAVKSVVVPAINILSNMAHLAARGVPLVDIAKGSKELTLEIEQYVKNRAKYLEIEADARVEQNPSRKLKLEKRLQNLEDANRRMQIWPLIEAGEFSSVSAADARLQDVQLTSGKLAEYIESKVEKMPDSTKNLGRYAFISADTPLFEALQKSVEYGDFVAKAILYKDMTKRLGKSKAEALGTITEEFISYDHLPGRTRGVIEDLGMYWFGNFKLRSIKIAAHMIRNNPLHSIFGMMLPVPQVFGNTGIPLDDNLLHLLYEGKAGYSVGLTQGINSIGLNPWVNGFNTLTN